MLSSSHEKEEPHPTLMAGRVAAMRKFFEEKAHKSPLDADLKFLLQNTNFTEPQIRLWFAEFIRACPKGRIDKNKFAMFYKQLDPAAEVSGEFCDHVFRCFDRDKSGFIDFKEFLIALNVKRSGDPVAKLRWVFQLYDIDGNGVIDLGEMTQIVECIFEMLGPDSGEMQGGFNAGACAMAVFQNIDANCDGKLTEDEFIEACKKDQFLYAILTSASMV